MKLIKAAIVTLGVLLASAATAGDTSKVVFMSCIKHTQPQPLWEEVRKEQADAVLLIGDNVYADSGDPEILKEAYAHLESQPAFQALRNETRIDGTWDDHDFGFNDGGRDFEGKDNAQQGFLDFFRVPEDSERRKRKGVYSSFMIGEQGKRIQVILLDTRYFRSDFNKNPQLLYYLYRYHPSKARDQDMLGDQQWAWLEEQLRKPAQLRIIASSIQFVASNHGFERWSALPYEKQKMIELIDKTEAKGVVFISGDRHISQLMQLTPVETGLDYPLLDLTSSGFNSSGAATIAIPTTSQIGDTVYEDNYGRIEVDWNSGQVKMDLLGEGGESWFHFSTRLKALGTETPENKTQAPLND